MLEKEDSTAAHGDRSVVARDGGGAVVGAGAADAVCAVADGGGDLDGGVGVDSEYVGAGV